MKLSSPISLGVGFFSHLPKFAAVALITLGASALLGAATVDPFANSATPPPPGYTGPTFQLSHNYPGRSVGLANPIPWEGVLGRKPISQATAGAYADALRAAVAADMKVLVADYPHWDASSRGWYNQPWLGSIREPIHGMFQATSTAGSLFNDPSLTVPFVNNFAAVYYNTTAAATLGGFWGKTAMTPTLTTAAGQFAEGSIIVKLAFTEVDGQQWPVMAGSPVWPIYTERVSEQTGNNDPAVSLFSVYLMQLDIIVKDSIASPKTGWVFTTLVYDHRIPLKLGESFWDRMIPLGAMWGNDPDVNSTTNPTTPLQETWVNPNAPAYSTATLGWGGRLSGPNDQAVQAPGDYIDPATGKPGTVPVANSSCMSCHSPAEWQFQSFLLPGTANQNGYYMAVPGSPTWMRWFQDRPGTVPMDPGGSTIALDYDMMFAFKALEAWSQATGTAQAVEKRPLFMRPSELRKGSPAGKANNLGYNGLPFKSDRK